MMIRSKIRAVLAEHIGTGGGQGLIDAEVHIPALAGVAACDLVPGITKGREHLGHRVIDQNVAVSQKQNLGATVLTGAVPTVVPQLPANLECDAGLASAGCQCGGYVSAEEDGLDDPIDCNFCW